MNHDHAEWDFSFTVSASEFGVKVSEEDYNALMDSIIDFVESRGLVVGGGFKPVSAEDKT